MAASISKSFLTFSISIALFISGVLGDITCEELDRSTCAFAVSSSGVRCVLEKHVRGSGVKEVFSCRDSGVDTVAAAGWIETDECVAACGLSRHTLGISSDLLLDGWFTERLCSPECYHGCPNIVDLYFNLAAGEGFFLPSMCEAKADRRETLEINSSGETKKNALAPEAATTGKLVG